MFFSLFFCHAFSEFPRPIALKLCRLIGICVYFIMQVQKLLGHSPQKNWGPKTCKISVNFGPLQTLIANISGTAENIQNRQFLLRLTKKVRWTLVHWRLGITCEIGPTKMHFLADYISAHRGRCAPKILHAQEIDQALIAHTRNGTGVPPQKKN